jgi:hypothetical protein
LAKYKPALSMFDVQDALNDEIKDMLELLRHLAENASKKDTGLEI